MESIIVHTKNTTELAALKSVLKDMNIEFEKFHTRNHFHNKKTITKIDDKTLEKIQSTVKTKRLIMKKIALITFFNFIN